MGGQRIQDVFLEILKDGFTVEDSFDTTDATDEPNKFACKVVLRSLIGVMAAASQERVSASANATAAERWERWESAWGKLPSSSAFSVSYSSE